MEASLLRGSDSLFICRPLLYLHVSSSHQWILVYNEFFLADTLFPG